jgi:hypothetical protein
MAERTGVPEIDVLIEAYLPEARENGFDTADGAAGMCWVANKKFWKRIVEHTLIHAELDGKPAERLGYADRTISGQFDDHIVTVVHDGAARFLVDFTAAQYGYTEFPMVQRLAPDGSWQRTW